ncbi:MAG: hypothetical protein V3T72_00365 [Thermoanaerobaculia bacterium]
MTLTLCRAPPTLSCNGRGRPGAVLALMLLGTTAAGAAAVELQLNAEPETADFGTIEASGLDPRLLRRLTEANLAEADWKAVFPVYTGRELPLSGDKPPVVGSWTVESEKLRFRPRYPLVAGLSYVARLDLDRLNTLVGDRMHATASTVVASFSLPAPDLEPSTIVSAVYPSADELPENQLRFYIHFSAPMGRGEAYEHIHLLAADRGAVAAPFLEIGEELWDPGMRRLTLFFDPGRIKRGLRPNLEVGPPLREGASYRLMIDAGWRDARGMPLAEGFQKAFTVAAPDRRAPNPAEWTLKPPPAGGREALEIEFPEPLDHGLLRRVLRVRDAADGFVAGRVEIGEQERRYRFTPAAPWSVGGYVVEIEAILEDLAGNNLRQVFDVDLTRDLEEVIDQGAIRLPFAVR